MTAPSSAARAAPPRPRVWLCRGDDAGWAVDEDLRLTRAALGDVVALVDDPAAADVVHAVWWEPLVELPAALLRGKRVVCHLTGDPVRCQQEPRFLRAMARVHHWVAQSRAAAAAMRTIGASVVHVPYAVDTAQFAAAPADGPLAELVQQHLRPLGADALVIANFHRDTAGAGLERGDCTPKLVKGPDLFVATLAELRRRGHNAVALLAGPRRHWVRRALTARGVPYLHIGETIAGDDYPANILPREHVGTLLKQAHLCLVTSRSEGGPRAVLEAGAASVPVLSSRTGHAPDVLPPECLFDDPLDAVDRIADDARTGRLRATVPLVAATIALRHSVAAVAARWREVYHRFGAGAAAVVPPMRPTPVPAAPRRRVLSLWNKFTPPPWGGGNQFMLALEGAAQRLGVECVRNAAGPDVGAHVVNSVQFDQARFEALVAPGSTRVVHRIDGPISTLRTTSESLADDRRCFDFNRRYATATVIQSWHTRQMLRALGLEPVRPVLVHNGCDPSLFFRSQQPPAPAADGRLRLCATSWSPNPGKGAAIYAWLDAHLDHARVAFTFVGNVPAQFANIRVVPPMPSAELGAFLRTQDVYLTASRNDPCSNALLEALQCGLPALYLRSGGHPELVGFGGLPFDRPDEVPALLQRLADHRAFYRDLISAPSLDDAARRYLQLAFDDEPYRA